MAELYTYKSPTRESVSAEKQIFEQIFNTRWATLTPREREVATLVCKRNGHKHYTNPQIADKLGISRETVKIHVRHILSKFDLHSKVELRRALKGFNYQ